MLGTIWDSVFIDPLSATLLWLNGVFGDLGLAIIVLTLLIQLVMMPLRLPSLKSAKKMRKLQPQLGELKEKHKEDKMALAQAQMDLYKEHDVNPLGGLLPTLLSIPIILALYRVLLSTVTSVEGISTQFAWFDLASPDPYYILPVAVGIAQLILSMHMMSHQTPPKVVVENASDKGEKKENTEDMMQSVQSQMKYIFPVISGVITSTLPAGVGIYWLTSVTFAIIQHQVVEKWT